LVGVGPAARFERIGGATAISTGVTSAVGEAGSAVIGVKTLLAVRPDGYE